MDNKNILVVDDDNEIRQLLQEYLQQNGLGVFTAADGVEMDQVLAANSVDLIILDLMLPGEDGLEICRRLRVEIDTPIIMLTARGEDTDRIVGLEMGADDYLPKPFNPRELLARIKVVLRRITRNVIKEPKTPDKFCFDGWELDLVNRQVISPSKVVVPLSGAEYRLLQIFLEHANRVLTRDQLMDWVVGRENTPFDRSIDVQVSRLRQRLSDSGRSPKLIKTVRGEGYVFTATVKKVLL